MSVASLCHDGDEHSGYQTKRLFCDQLKEDLVSEIRIADSCETQPQAALQLRLRGVTPSGQRNTAGV